MAEHKKLTVTLLCGGFSSEREVSLMSGKAIADALDKEKYEVNIVTLPNDRNSAFAMLHDLLPKPDIAFIGLHGKFGEDGRVQAVLDTLGIPYTGSGVMASAIGMNKMKTMDIARLVGVRVPTFFTIPDFFPPTGIDETIQETFGYPCVVKPSESGSSIGVTIVRKADELPLALQKAFVEDHTAVVQQYIPGRELTCGVLGNTHHSTDLVGLPSIEIVPPEKFFDYEAKYSPQTKEICPADLTQETEAEIVEAAKKIHAFLSCDGLTRSDFILGEEGRLYFLEINTLPGMTVNSLCPKAAKAAGWSFGELLDKIIELGLERHRE